MVSTTSALKQKTMKAATPALIFLDRAGVHYEMHSFDHALSMARDDLGYGESAAHALGVNEGRVFKTLLLASDTGSIVGIVPVNKQVSMKAMAKTVGAKRCEMLNADDVARITGYVIGGVSPFGQKRLLPTVIDESALLFDTIFVSGGRRGLEVEVMPPDLISLLGATAARIATL